MTTKTLGRSKRQGAALTRYFGDLPVRDATRDIVLFPNQDDVSGAEQKSPEKCVLARCSVRQLGATAVVFFRRYAYIDLPQKDGLRVLERFRLSASGQRMVEQFDLRKPLPKGGITMKAPGATSTMAAARHYEKEQRKREKAGLVNPNRQKRRTVTGVRNGQGMVHFSRTAASA